ncbi:Phosphoenolpyruvate-protein phosphotransferase [Rubripirellula amarantea]|uniref:phosphoenolpyruvate--protein phosphotransferase n=1 Tax=Rubripirellula amarantea TaxID=2527999 RepID=A0A5C5WUP4_9BACT|nr:phosphoenolpyruvate--protein phosphotransferase [Rubripirellula amarantea]TWT54366.1 Phosphoenolpyruvate-protein phosphotransferase [Rubripirellula amarantea]
MSSCELGTADASDSFANERPLDSSMSLRPAKPSNEQLGLSTLEDISHLILQSHDLNETLQNIVALVASRMRTEVCTIYLCEGDQLSLSATVGLSSKAVGQTQLKVGQGLVGHTAKTCSVVNVTEPQLDERYCFIVDSDEEIYHSFLGIPVFDRGNLLGVMAIQTIAPRVFDAVEISTLSTIAFQLSSVVANARLLNQLALAPPRTPITQRTLESPEQTHVTLVRGEQSFGGVVIGPAHVIDGAMGVAEIVDEATTDSVAEIEKLNEAFAAARIQTLYLEKKIAERLDERDAAIFHSHLMILQDRVFVDKIKALIHDGFGAISAVKQVVSDYVRTFREIADPYLRARSADVEDVGRRLLAHLCGKNPGDHLHLAYSGIVVAHELHASEIAVMDLDRVQGIVLEKGDSNSHAVIVAKSLGIPTIIGAADVVAHVEPGCLVILDAPTKTLHIEPSKTLRREYARLVKEAKSRVESLQRYVDQPATTTDGLTVTLRANIGLRSDVEIAVRNGAEGVGLYRTELPYMAQSSFPDREAQYEIYRHVVEGFRNYEVTIRTLDIGGDKPLSYFDTPREDNPFLGWRSIRVSLDNLDIFRTQIEAILMAATHGNVKLMFPMVTNIDEIVQAKSIVNEARKSLTQEGWDIPDVPIGMMIETPSSVIMADLFAREVDFFSLGTNDLVQYLLAADRGNTKISNYYQSLHPAVLKAIATVVDVAQRHKIPVSICGEMVGDPRSLGILVGLGLREFSVSSPLILSLKAMLVEQSAKKLKKLAKDCLKCSTTAEIKALTEKTLGAI